MKRFVSALLLVSALHAEPYRWTADQTITRLTHGAFQMLSGIVAGIRKPSGGANPSVAQKKFCGTAGGGTSEPCTFTSNPTAGHALWLWSFWDSTATDAISGGCSVSWVQKGSQVDGTGSLAGFHLISMFCPSASGGATTITMDMGGVSTSNMFLQQFELTGTGSVTVDGTASLTNVTAVAGLITTGSTTTSGGDLLLGFCGGVDSQCTLGSGGWVSQDSDGMNALTGQLTESKTGVGAGSQTATFGAGTTDNSMVGIIAFH